MFSLEQSLAIPRRPGTRRPAGAARIQRIAWYIDRRHVGAPIQSGAEPSGVQPARKPWTTDGPESNLFGLEPNFGCCTANFNQGWPKFAASLFMLSHDDGLVAAAYAPCEVRTMVRDTQVHLVEETNYPFPRNGTADGQSRLSAGVSSSAAHPAMGRGDKNPCQWSTATTARAGSFARIERTWKTGDRVEVEFPLEPRVSRWFHGSVAVERGPPGLLLRHR
jgi:DUF1680 family protein